MDILVVICFVFLVGEFLTHAAAGARYEKTEFLYGNEMYDWENDGLITEMHCAFRCERVLARS